MTNSPEQKLAALQVLIAKHRHITLATPSSPNYASLRKIFARDQHAVPLAIVRPQSAADVSLLIKFAVATSISFTVRVGGHNLAGASFAQDALAIDMRDIAYTNIAADKKTARVGGGILQLDLAVALEKEGLATPLGMIASVGYVGWATYGGYGPFSNRWGLGCDQIVGAKVVNSEGEIVEADERLLKGLRGGGGLFGVIIEVTIKVQTLKSVLAGALILASHDLATTFKDFNAVYQDISVQGLPSELVLQQIVMNSPMGRAMAVSFMWSSDDIEQGRAWLAKTEALAPVAMNTVAVSTIPDVLRANLALVPESIHGASCTHNLKRVTSEVAVVIGESFAGMNDNAGCMFTIHELRGVSAAVNKDSVFGTREPHFMLEILGYSATVENKNASMAWAEKTWARIAQTDPSNLLPGTYISLDRPASDTAPVPLSRLYGSNHEELRALKKEFDSNNVFSLAIPLLQNYS